MDLPQLQYIFLKQQLDCGFEQWDACPLSLITLAVFLSTAYLSDVVAVKSLVTTYLPVKPMIGALLVAKSVALWVLRRGLKKTSLASVGHPNRVQ